MSSTSDSPADALALELFDQVIIPLSEERLRKGNPPFFPRSGDSARPSYFEAPARRVMMPADFEFPGGGTPDGLVDTLAAHWAREGEDGLAAIVPHMLRIAEALRLEAEEADGDVDILCYTMF